MAVPERNGVIKSKSMTIAGQKSFQSYSQEKAVSQSFKSITNSSSFSQTTAQEHKSVDKSSSRMAIAGDGRIAGNTAAEADMFLEELMEEAKKDPSFGVVPGMNKNNDTVDAAKHEKKERGAIERFNYAAADTNNNNDSRPGSSAGGAPDNYPFIPRPYRTAQDMIITDKNALKKRGKQFICLRPHP